MNRIAQAAIATTIVAFIFALGALTGALIIHHHDTGAANTASVSDYNDGWTDSKADDCEQHSAYACQWLHGTK